MKIVLQSIFYRRLLLLTLSLGVFSCSIAQHLTFENDNLKVEAGLNFGPTFFLGDLGGKVGKGTRFVKDLNYNFTKLMKGAFISVYPSNWFGLRLAGQYTYLEGDDKVISTNGVDELWRKQRNLDFKSNVWEVYLAAEIFPLEYFKRNDEDYAPRFRPYVFGGVGLYHFNPQGSLTDQNGNVSWHDLQPLHTEGQGFPGHPSTKQYSLNQLNLPYGGGIKYMISDRANIAIELLYRKTFTDYIDDVSTVYIDPNEFDANLPAADAIIARQISDKVIGIVTPGVNRYAPGTQRGSPKQDDAYFSFVLKFGLRLGPIYNSPYQRNAASQARCPARF
jgi:Outer membrane protein beta-barrel domain